MDDNVFPATGLSTLREEWQQLLEASKTPLQSAVKMWRDERAAHEAIYMEPDATEFRNGLQETLVDEIRKVQNAIADFSARAIAATHDSPMATPADQAEIRISARKMIAALDLEDYHFFDAEVLSYEDQYLGMRQASQRKISVLPGEAARIFDDAAKQVSDLLLFISNEAVSASRPTQSVPSVSGAKSRPDTAFIMMMMSDDHPELEDVKVGIVEVFREFGIHALRADDIEHEGSITDRIKQEIASSEFLIADLTGARPNVYYEVGYAHALGKRTILYRKKDTALHFDLAGLNVPGYSNVADLKMKLRARLEATLGTASPVSKQHRAQYPTV